MSRSPGKKSKGKSSVNSKMSNKQQPQSQNPKLSFSQQLINDVLVDTEYQQPASTSQMEIETNLNAGLLQCIIQNNPNGLNDLVQVIKQLDEQKLEDNIRNFMESKCNQLALMLIESLQKQISSFRALQKLRILDALVKTQKPTLTKENIVQIAKTVSILEQSNIPVQQALRARGKIQLLS